MRYNATTLDFGAGDKLVLFSDGVLDAMEDMDLDAKEARLLHAAPAEGMDARSFALKLFLARKKAEIALANEEDFYICSLSDQVVAYKGLMMPVDLPSFYLDLGNKAVETSICVFHQRFSTNTMPRWPLAQPF